jgi:hypothetical protein
MSLPDLGCELWVFGTGQVFASDGMSRVLNAGWMRVHLVCRADGVGSCSLTTELVKKEKRGRRLSLRKTSREVFGWRRHTAVFVFRYRISIYPCDVSETLVKRECLYGALRGAYRLDQAGSIFFKFNLRV